MKLSLYSLAVSPCYHGAGPFGCAVLSWGYFRAEGASVDGTGYASAGVRTGWEIELSESWRGAVLGEATVPLNRVEVGSQGEQLWRAPLFAAGGGVQVGRKF